MSGLSIDPGEQEVPAPIAMTTNAAANPNPTTLVVQSETGRDVMLLLPEVCMGPPRVGDDTTRIRFRMEDYETERNSARSGNEKRRVDGRLEDDGGGPPHLDGGKSRGLSPGYDRDAERPAEQMDGGLAPGLAAPLETGRHGGRTCARAAGQGDAAATLPDHELDPLRTETGQLDVGAAGEESIV